MMRFLLGVIAVVFFISDNARAQKHNLFFKRITKDEGLSSNKVLCITQDQTGFMWFGTEDGLTRFDGANFLIYRHDPKNKFSLSNNYVNCVYEDPRNGNLWIGTAKGLNYLNRTDNKIYSASTHADTVLKDISIFSVLVDSKNNRWVGTARGLFVYPDKSDKPVLRLRNTDPSLAGNVACLYEDSKKNVWAGTTFGLFVFDNKKKRFKKVGLNTPFVVSVLSVSEDSRRDIWVTSASGAFNFRNGQVRRYAVENNFLRSNKVHGLVEDEFGNMLFAVRDGGGLHYLDYQKNTITILANDIYNPSSISSGVLTAIYKDKFKNIWLGTWAKGLNFIDKNHKLFAHYKINFKSDGLRSNNVRTAFQDSDGDIWIGTKDEGYLSKFNPEKGTFTHYDGMLINPRSAQNFFVLSIAEAKPGLLLIGTHEGGLIIFDKKNGRFVKYLNNPKDKFSLANNMVPGVFKDRYNKIWVASIRRLQTFDLKSGKFNLVDGIDYVKCFYDYSPNEIYFGGRRGLFHYNRKTGEIIRFHKENNNLNSGALPDITGIVKGADGNLWLTTVGRGLMQFNPRTKQFKSYTVDEGLPSNIICGIQTDNKGNLWMSSSNGLSKFSLSTRKFRNYYVSEGLQGNEFEKYVSYKTKDGHIIFGGSNGFNYFYPDSIKDNRVIPKVVITDFKIFNQPVKVNEDNSPLKESISTTRKLVLNYKQSVITFEFAALNFSSPVYNQYAYKLEPLEKEWNYIGVRNIASYSSLPAGTYKFKVKASNNDGLWNDVPTTLEIKVLPPPWKSWWAYLFYFSVLGGIIYLWLRYKNFQTQLHIAQLEQNKLQELHAIKSQFFTNISHEFKTPLTMILSPLNKLMRIAQNEDERKHLGYIKRNALRLQKLINQLMELKSIDNDTVAPHYIKGDIVAFVIDLTQVFEPLAEEHNIRIDCRKPKSIITYFDSDKIEKIFYNLLSNAVKFTPDGGIIEVSVERKSVFSVGDTSFDTPVLQFRVRNTGSKIAAHQLPHIFENYYHIDRPSSLVQPNTGIGLAFTKELVELLGGSIGAESDDEWTSFTVNIPEVKTLEQDMGVKPDLNADRFVYSQQLLEILKFEKETIEPKDVNEKAPSVLLVEDNKELRELLFNALAKEYKVTVACDGYAGLQLAKKIHPVLIISDIVMPRLSGVELCREIKQNIEFNHIPVVLLTASNTDTQRLEGMESGADVYIEKPFDLEFFKLQVKNIIQTRKAQREAFAKKLSPEPEKVAANSANEEFVMKAIALVEKNMDNSEFDVDAFVKEMNMSRTALYQKIRSLTDLSINEFIINIRLKRAAHLLKTSDHTVSEIAFKVGFNSPSYFGICFKRNFKISPTAFIEQFKEPVL
ncbi:two-component regulator propeller domain-containing protein [Paradesertivirga mongoliensis]|uniref:histidine kinase n=1 Tax=Paradesertivirga mongoliensis TaxID=2100740 RepID=A0ABW4ZKM5_9SPHI|nr:hybrid sensor histidine kinase/response regulator transcription factor [Pedobacter mongoliensis]